MKTVDLQKYILKIYTFLAKFGVRKEILSRQKAFAKNFKITHYSLFKNVDKNSIGETCFVRFFRVLSKSNAICLIWSILFNVSSTSVP